MGNFTRRYPGGFLAALALALAVLLAAAPSPARAEQLYLKKIRPSGSAGSIATDLNDNGQVVGVADIGGTESAFLYDNGSITDINPAGWAGSIAMSISANGNIAGFGSDGGIPKGFVRSGDTTTALLPPGWTEARATSVNDAGAVVGWGSDGAEKGFGFSSGFYFTFLPPGFTSSRAQDVNSAGWVVGSATNAGGKQAFLFDGAYRFPGFPGWTATEAVAINDRGDILGNGQDGAQRKCFLLRDGTYTVISDPISILSLCLGLNEAGDVSGVSVNSSGGIKSFVYRDGTYHYFDQALFTIYGSGRINNKRQLAGSVDIDGVATAVLASILPLADLQVKGGDGPVTAFNGPSPPISLSLLAWTFVGRPVEWWFFVQTPAGTYSFDVPTRRWIPGFLPSMTFPLRDINTVKLPPAGNGRGAYTYYFGIDFARNGVLDMNFFVFDSITVILQ